MKEFDSILNKEYKRIFQRTNGQPAWTVCLGAVRKKLSAKHDRGVLSNKSTYIIRKNWKDFLILEYRGIVTRHCGISAKNEENTFERTILIWHNRLRGFWNSRGFNQDRSRGKTLTEEELKWKFLLERKYSSLIGRHRLTGWNRVIDYSYRYILKAEKRKNGTIPRSKEYCTTWTERIHNINENIKRRHSRRNDGWRGMLDSNHLYLINREKIRLGVLKNGEC